MHQLFYSLFFILSLFAEAKPGLNIIQTTEDIRAFFPLTVEEISTKKKTWIKEFDRGINEIIDEKNPSFNTVVRKFDEVFYSLTYAIETLNGIPMVHPDPEVCKEASKAASEISKHMRDSLSSHPEIYTIISSVPTKELSIEERYLLKEFTRELKNLGLDLPKEKQKEIKHLKDEITDLEQTFARNIRESNPKVFVSNDDLKGMDEKFIQSLNQDEKGMYELNTSYPISIPVMAKCQVESTRYKLYLACTNKAFPENLPVLKDLSIKRYELANKLGFDSYAHLQLSGEMVQTPERTKEFLNNMAHSLSKKMKNEMALVKAHLPEGVQLNKEGKIDPWNMKYIMSSIEESLFKFDDEIAKDYFPLKTTFQGLMKVYESFFNLKIEEITCPKLWHEDVRLMRVKDPFSSNIHGYIVLDLHPREGKFSHACCGAIIPALKTKEGFNPALSFVICNFPKGRDNEPSLMRLNDVSTFFHEFGHALHNMLGRTEFFATAGPSTTRDFVEMPSQILEEWLNDPKILQMVSSHYKTGEKLPLDLIEKRELAKNAFTGLLWIRQIMLANFSLNFHLFPCSEPLELWEKLHNEFRPDISLSKKEHWVLSFGHLDEYAACYYGYLWSKVFALDVFEKINQEGLLNPAAGKQYTDAIIGRGGSCDPNQLLYDFLKREPNQEAFLKSIGLKEE